MNTAANIEITTTGASQAAAGLNEVTKGFEQIGASHDALRTRFQEKFQHIGLMLFAGEALRANGVGMETRQVVNLLNMGLTAMMATGAGASGGILLAVTALISLGGILEKVLTHKTKMSEQDEKQIAANQKLIENYEKINSELDKYQNVVGPLPGFIQKWADAQKELNEVTLQKQNLLLMDNVAALNTKEVAEKESIESTQAIIKAGNDHIAMLHNLVGDGMVYNAAVKLNTTESEKLNKTLIDQKQAFTQTDAELKIAEANLTALHKGYADVEDAVKKRIAIGEEEIKEQKKIDEAHQKGYEAFLKNEEEENKAWQKGIDEREKEHEKFSNKIMEQAGETFKQIDSEQSHAFAKMVVEGESFGQATAHLWRNIAEQVIAQIERMVIEYEIWMAVTGGTGVASGGFSSFVGKALGFAAGGSVMVDQPTLFLAGEGGQPEIATFTPLSKMGGAAVGSPDMAGGGSSLSIGTIQTNVYGVSDPKAIAAQVGDAIVTRIRSRGDLDFVRA